MSDDERPALGGGAIILLGHRSQETLDQGIYRADLSQVAKARCEKAAELAAQFPEYLILPTGGFGAFNRTTRPHGELLRDYLVTLGTARERILPHTNSSNTVEDALFARNILVRCRRSKVIVVTSDFHMRRASYIFRRTLPDFDLTFIESDGSSASSNEIQSEPNKLMRLQNEWVDVPLCGILGSDNDTLTEVYRATAAEHKHYDTVSTAVISGLFVVFAFPYTVNVQPSELRPWIFLFSAAAIIFFWLIYNRMAWNARTARNALHHIESQLGGGFSLSYPRQDKFHKNGLIFKLTARGVSITRAVNIMALVMLIVQLILLGRSLFSREPPLYL